SIRIHHDNPCVRHVSGESPEIEFCRVLPVNHNHLRLIWPYPAGSARNGACDIPLLSELVTQRIKQQPTLSEEGYFDLLLSQRFDVESSLISRTTCDTALRAGQKHAAL